MKKSKGKGFDAKEFFLNHGEKVGAGVVALLAMMGLASAGWKGAAETPDEMKAAASSTLSQMQNSTWPDTDKAEFGKTPDVIELARRMSSPNEDVEQFAPSIAFNPTLNQVREKRTAVTVLAPETPEQIAFSSPIALIELDEEELDTETEDATKGDSKEEESEEDRRRRERFGPATGGVAGSGSPFNGGGPGLGMGGDGLSGMGGPGFGMGGGGGMPGLGMGGGGGMPGLGMGGGGGMPGMGNDGLSGMGGGGMPGLGMGGGGGMPGMGMGDGGEGGYGDYGMYGGMLGSSVKEKRIRYTAAVSVRYVFNLYEQRKKVAEALHLPISDPRVRQYAEDFIDVHVERKQAMPSTDPWSGEWETVSADDLAEILDESLGFDLEVVNSVVTRPVITMPLPRRAQGTWGKEEASHRRISDFELSAEEKELIRKRDEKLAKEIEERKAKLPPAKAEKKGFAGYKGNANEMMSSMFGNGSGQDDFYDEFGEDFGDQMMGSSAPGNSKNNKDELAKLRKKLFEPSAADRLLLVRFMDFTVERGQQYIYRVRLELNNPNFNMPVDQLEQPELATQKTIMSEWSAPTAPVFVPAEYRYYVKKTSTSSDEKADLSMYYEVPDMGTPVMTDFSMPIGIRIGAEKDIDVVDLSKSVLDRATVDLRSRDILCSVYEAPRFSSADHPDLKSWLDKLPRGQKPVGDQITVMTPAGTLVNRSAGDATREMEKDEGDIDFLIKEYEKIGWRKKQGGDSTGDPFSGYDDGMGGDDDFGDYGMGEGDPLSGGGGGRGRGNRGGNDRRGGGFGRP